LSAIARRKQIAGERPTRWRL